MTKKTLTVLPSVDNFDLVCGCMNQPQLISMSNFSGDGGKFPLVRGDKGNKVKDIQFKLGLDTDGVFGKKTEAGIKSWGYSTPLSEKDYNSIISGRKKEPDAKPPVFAGTGESLLEAGLSLLKGDKKDETKTETESDTKTKTDATKEKKKWVAPVIIGAVGITLIGVMIYAISKSKVPTVATT